jgi:hypothetical protein
MASSICKYGSGADSMKRGVGRPDLRSSVSGQGRKTGGGCAQFPPNRLIMLRLQPQLVLIYAAFAAYLCAFWTLCLRGRCGTLPPKERGFLSDGFIMPESGLILRNPIGVKIRARSG